ncbi:type II toxin-antitoxin system RelE/ParE family toxin [Achromobacter sp. UMC46]|uniref:type II toxin-antitoxin system RelE/ParE family toxin n=1 Tax=Achromobacter sp. UMC46 TaxID=1862319 RepID=UPI0021071406|nr:type II toxin-antitoxin system RelE/ParE family toxin [Achromobacter sp. UMC46]
MSFFDLLKTISWIRRYIRKHFSQATWLNAYAKIQRAILNLQKCPLTGHAPPELPSAHFLEFIAAKNRVIYEIIGNTVYIHIICDVRQDFKTKLARRPLRALK